MLFVMDAKRAKNAIFHRVFSNAVEPLVGKRVLHAAQNFVDPLLGLLLLFVGHHGTLGNPCDASWPHLLVIGVVLVHKSGWNFAHFVLQHLPLIINRVVFGTTMVEKHSGAEIAGFLFEGMRLIASNHTLQVEILAFHLRGLGFVLVAEGEIRLGGDHAYVAGEFHEIAIITHI